MQRQGTKSLPLFSLIHNRARKRIKEKKKKKTPILRTASPRASGSDYLPSGREGREKSFVVWNNPPPPPPPPTHCTRVFTYDSSPSGLVVGYQLATKVIGADEYGVFVLPARQADTPDGLKSHTVVTTSGGEWYRIYVIT